MRVTLTHITAAYYWLMTTMDGTELAGLGRRGSLGACPETPRDLGFFELGRYQVEDRAIELLTTDAGSRPDRGRFDYHVSGREFPAGAFVMLEGSVQIASPELSFWQLSKILPLGELVKYGNALCGRRSYALDSDGRMIERRVPLTSARAIADFVRLMGTSRRNDRALRAVRYLVDGADSPMENCISVLLCLKRQYGGFAFRKPILGFEVELDEVGRRMTGKGTCRCDMYWSKANYDLEYDSDQEHNGTGSATKDSLRRSAIKRTGITVCELRTPQVKDADIFDATAREIARDIGHRVRERSPEDEFRHYEAYLELRRQLFWRERRDSGLDASPLRIGELDW